MKGRYQLPWIGIIGLYLLGMLVVQKVSSVWLPNRTDFEAPVKIYSQLRSTIMPWLNFDGRNYLDIAMRGYFQKGTNNLRAFFPLYPFLIRLLSVNTVINPVYTGLIFSLLCFTAGTGLFYRWLKKQYDNKIATRSLILLLCFPTSFFFLAYYTESLFFLLTVFFFYTLRQKRYWLSALGCALATATRIVGLALIPVLGYELFLRFRKTKQLPWEILPAPAGFLLYIVYSRLETGSWLASLNSFATFDRQITLWGPLTTLAQGLSKIIAGPLSTYNSPFVYPVIILEVITLAYLLVIAIKMYKHIETGMYIYFGGSLVFLLSSNILSSISRYTLVLFPIFVYLARNLSKRTFMIYIAISLAGLIFCTSLFLKGYWVA